jgi:hypothetical protein
VFHLFQTLSAPRSSAGSSSTSTFLGMVLHIEGLCAVRSELLLQQLLPSAAHESSLRPALMRSSSTAEQHIA